MFLKNLFETFNFGVAVRFTYSCVSLSCVRLLTSPFCLVAEILYSLDRLSEAECLYRELIHRNPENYYYFEQLEKCLFLGESKSLEERGKGRGEGGGGGASCW